MSLALLTAPTVEPVTLADVKTYLRVDNTSDDTDIAAMITDARSWIEERSGIRLITQTWRWTVDIHWKAPGVATPSNDYQTRVPERYGDRVIRYGMWIQHQPYLRFPLWPAQSVAQITYRQSNQDVVYTDIADVRVLPNGKIIFDPAAPPPLPDEQEGAITVDCVVGYGDTVFDVPSHFGRAIKMLCGHWYENRGLYLVTDSGQRLTTDEMAASVSAIIGQHRKLSI